jgi:hypothetical protein
MKTKLINNLWICLLAIGLATNAEAKKPTIQIKPSEYILGCWFKPHDAGIKMKFTRDGHFIFNDYNDILGKEEVLKGKYAINGAVLTLYYDDRPKQNFKYYKGTNGDKNYYIRKGEYYFVKSETCDW